MEIIDYHNDCEALKVIFQEVYDRLPAEDQVKIEQTCSKIEFCTEPNIPDDPEPFHAAFHFFDHTILVAANGMLVLCPAKQRAILVHELGHARDRFDNPITAENAGKSEEKRRAEAAANGYAYKWGFGDDLELLHGCKPTDYTPE